MTNDDKEERRYLELTKFEWEHGYAAYLNRTELMLIFKRPRIEWSELPLAPKHTDEEYDALEQALDEKSLCASCEKLWDGDACEWTCPHCQIKYLQSCIKELEADYAKLINHTDPDYVTGLQRRIKKLEAQADNCIVCGTVRRVEELRAKERAKSSSRPLSDKKEG